MRESRGKLSGAWCAKLRLLLATALGISLYSFHLKSLSFFSHTCVYLFPPVSLSPHSYCPSNLSVGGLGRNRQWTGLHMTPLYLSMYALRRLYVCYHALHLSLYLDALGRTSRLRFSALHLSESRLCQLVSRERKRVYKAFRISLSFFFLPLLSFLLQRDRQDTSSSSSSSQPRI